MPTRDEVNALRPYFYDRPPDPYVQDSRPFGRSDLVNHIAEFEDSQASPYSFAAGGFSISLGSGAVANSTYARHCLSLHQNGSATQSYLQWTDSTSKKINVFLAITNGAGADSYHSEIRWWGVQSPGAGDKYYTLRFRYGANCVQAGFFYGTGVTFAVGDGTQVGNWWNVSTLGRFLFIQFYSTATPLGIVDIYDTATQVLLNQFAGGTTGWPTALKTIRFYLPANGWANYRIDRVYAS